MPDFLFLGSKITADGDCSQEIRRRLFIGRKAMTNLDGVLKRETLLCWQRFIKSRLWYSQWSHTVVRAGLPKHWCLQTVVLEKTLESPVDSKEIKPVNLKGDQPWILTGRTETEAEASVFWSSGVNRQLTGKVPDAGKTEAEGEEGIRGWDGWMASLRQWTWMEANTGRWWRKDREAWHASVHGVEKMWTQLGDWENNSSCKC